MESAREEGQTPPPPKKISHENHKKIPPKITTRINSPRSRADDVGGVREPAGGTHGVVGWAGVWDAASENSLNGKPENRPTTGMG